MRAHHRGRMVLGLSVCVFPLLSPVDRSVCWDLSRCKLRFTLQFTRYRSCIVGAHLQAFSAAIKIVVAKHHKCRRRRLNPGCLKARRSPISVFCVVNSKPTNFWKLDVIWNKYLINTQSTFAAMSTSILTQVTPILCAEYNFCFCSLVFECFLPFLGAHHHRVLQFCYHSVVLPWSDAICHQSYRPFLGLLSRYFTTGESQCCRQYLHWAGQWKLVN